MARNKGVQIHSKERLNMDRGMSKDEIARFLDEFQQIIQGNEGRRKLISLRVPERLLAHFRKKAAISGVPYQTQILNLMREWLKER